MSEEKNDYAFYSEALHSSYLFYTMEVDRLNKQLLAAKEENERLRNLLGKPYKRRIDLENNNLTQQNKQMRENINNIKNLCNEDWEDMTVDKFQNQLLQVLKGVE